MDLLATTQDVLDRTGDLPPAVVDRLPALLADASTRVRSYTGQNFTKATTTTRLRPVSGKLRLPQRPVLSVSDVTVLSNPPMPVPAAAWMWDGGDEVWIDVSGMMVVNFVPDWPAEFDHRTPMVELTYEHGYEEVPDDVVAVVCSIATRASTSSGPSGISEQQVGPYSYRLSNAAQDGVLGMTEAEQKMLKRYKRVGGSVELR